MMMSFLWRRRCLCCLVCWWWTVWYCSSFSGAVMAAATNTTRTRQPFQNLVDTTNNTLPKSSTSAAAWWWSTPLDAANRTMVRVRKRSNDQPRKWTNHSSTVVQSHRQTSSSDTTTNPTTSNDNKQTKTKKTTTTPQNLCACQPGKWEFTFDFSRKGDCTDTNLNPSVRTGLASVTCVSIPPTSHASRSPLTSHTVDALHWNMIEFVQIQEYNAQHDWLNHEYQYASPPGTKHLTPQEELEGPFGNGQAFAYTSVVSTMTRTMTNTPSSTNNKNDNKADSMQQLLRKSTIPTSLTVHLFGRDASQNLLDFEFTLEFTNDCKTFPVVFPGDYIGPVTVVRILYLLSVYGLCSMRMF